MYFFGSMKSTSLGAPGSHEVHAPERDRHDLGARGFERGRVLGVVLYLPVPMMRRELKLAPGDDERLVDDGRGPAHVVAATDKLHDLQPIALREPDPP